MVACRSLFGDRLNCQSQMCRQSTCLVNFRSYPVNPLVLERCHLHDLLHCCSTLFAILLFQLHKLHGCCLLCLLDLLCNSCSTILWCLILFDLCCFIAAVVLRLGKSTGKLLLCKFLISSCSKVPASRCVSLHYENRCRAFGSRAVNYQLATSAHPSECVIW